MNKAKKQTNKQEKLTPFVNMDALSNFDLEPNKYDYAFKSVDSSGNEKSVFIKKE